MRPLPKRAIQTHISLHNVRYASHHSKLCKTVTAIAFGCSVSIPYEDRFNDGENHYRAASELMTRMEWWADGQIELVTGVMPDGSHVHVMKDVK